MNRTAVTLTALIIPFLTLTTAQAQGTKLPPPPTAPTKASPPAIDPNAVRSQLYDLVLLGPLQSVDLTEEQIKAIVPVLKQVIADDKERRDKDDDAAREMAEEVRKARTGALNGEPIPKEVQQHAAELQKAATARLAAARRSAVEKVLTALWPLLTPTQKSSIEVISRAMYGGRRVPAAYSSDPAKAPKEEVQKLAVGGFIENVLLDDAALPLLESLKPLKSETAPAASGDTTNGTKP